MSTETDCYGMTPEERAEFERDFVAGHGEHLDPDGSYTCQRADLHARGWAACAKLYRERLARQAGALKTFQITNLEVAYGRVTEEMKATVVHAKREVVEVQAANSILTDEVEKLQIGNNALLARIKELEMLDLETLEAENVIWHNKVKELEAENERLRAELRNKALESLSRIDQEIYVEQLKADAARLDWAIEVCGAEYEVKISPRSLNEYGADDEPFKVTYWGGASYNTFCGKTIRAAIDAAMKGGE